MPPSDWVIRFRLLAEEDAYLAEFENCELVTNADAQRWAREVSARLSTFGRKVYLLINLDGLKVKPAASREFGRLRAEILDKYSVTSFRFGGDRATVTSVLTSSVLTHAAANHYANLEDAKAALRRERLRRT